MTKLGPLVLLCAGLVSGGCSAATRSVASHDHACAAPHAAYTRHELYFGMGIPGSAGDLVTDDEWNAFSEEVLTPRFPAGMTVVEADGEWLGDDGIHYREPTRVVIHLAPAADDDRAAAAVEVVIAEAKRRFAQQSVLWQRSPVCVAF